jgi:hypothetical protein
VLLSFSVRTRGNPYGFRPWSAVGRLRKHGQRKSGKRELQEGATLYLSHAETSRIEELRKRTTR